MKIAVFTNHIDSGGVCNVLSQLTAHLAKRHLVVLYYSQKFEPFYKFDEKVAIKKLEIRSGFIKNIKFLRKNSYQFLLRRELKKEKFDILIATKTTQNLTAIWANLGLKTRLIICEHGEYNLVDKAKLRFYRRLYYPLCDMLFVLTPKDTLQYGFVKNVAVVPNPVNFAKFDKNLKENLVVAVGRLSAEKRFKDFIIACNQLANEIKKSQIYSDKSRLNSNETADEAEWKFWLVGDGSERENLIQLNEKCGGAVCFVGKIKDMNQIYSKAKILVSTSPSEGFGLTLIECVSCDVARVSARFSGDYKMILQDNQDALLFDPGDTVALKKCIERLMNDEKMRSNLAKNSQIYIEKFAPEKIFTIWDEILEKLV